MKWENGEPVTAKEVAFGMQRCMDAATFPTGPCQYYSNAYFKGGSTYKGLYTAPSQKFNGIKVNGNTITIKMAKPFPDMPYWGTFPANGPIPLGKVSDPKTYKNHPLVDRSLHDQEVQPRPRSSCSSKNPNWDPNTDPARTQYPDGYDFKMQQPSEKIDQILLADSGHGQTTMTYDDLLAPDFNQMKKQSPDRLILGGSPCTYYWAPDNRKITDKKVRQALSVGLPLQERDPGGGLIPGVNAIPATNLMPPGLPGRTPYNVTGHKAVPDRPGQGQVAAEVGQRDGLRDQVPVPDRRPDQRQGQGRDRQGADRGRLQGHPGADHDRRTTSRHATTPRKTSTSAPRAGAPTGRRVRPGSRPCSGRPTRTRPTRSARTTRRSATRRVDTQINAIQTLPLDQQAAAWNDLDKQIAQKYFPLFPTYYTGIAQAHGSKIQGDERRQHPRYADLEGHLGLAVIHPPTVRSADRTDTGWWGAAHAVPHHPPPPPTSTRKQR